MRRYPKLYLLLSSLLFLSCSISRFKNKENTSSDKLSLDHILPVVNPKGVATKYKATIDVLNKHFSGLLITKKTDSSTTHVIFITELGMKMFDLEKKDSIIKVVFVFEPLNKPNLISVLKTNFKNMLLMDVYGEQVQSGVTKKNEKFFELLKLREKRFFVVKNLNQLQQQAIFYKRRKSSLINYQYNAETKLYDKIQSIQYGLVKVKIELNAISGSN